MNPFQFLQRLRNGRSGVRRGAPPAVEAALRAKRARAHLARKRSRGGRRSGPRLPSGLLEEGALDFPGAPDAPERLFAIDRSIPAGPLPTTRDEAPAPTRPDPSAGTRAVEPRRAAAAMPADLFAATGAGMAQREGRFAAPLATRPAGRPTPPRRSAPRAVLPPTRPLPRFVVPISTALALGLGFVAARPLFERVWLPRVPLARVAVVGTAVRQPDSIARALLANAGAPLDRIDAERVAALVTADPWIESTESFRLPTGTLLVRVVERRAIARYQPAPESEITLLDPTGRPFTGAVGLGGALPLVEGPVDGDGALSPATLEILEELRRHADLARDPMALTLHLPGSVAIAQGLEARSRSKAEWADDAALSGDRSASLASHGGGEAAAASDSSGEFESLAGESGYVLEIGREGPRALLGQSFLKRRIARLAALLAQRDALVARARVIDLRFADRAVLRTEPTSG